MNKDMIKECLDALESVNGLVVKSEGVDCKFDDLIYRLTSELLQTPQTIEDYFKEWEVAIIELSEKEKEQINLKETYAGLEQDILLNFDFKEVYGKNNETIRKNHIKNELSDIVDRQNELKLRIAYLNRRIDFIKSLMKMQGTLIDSGVLE